jgi:hypothetical protein
MRNNTAKPIAKTLMQKAITKRKNLSIPHSLLEEKQGMPLRSTWPGRFVRNLAQANALIFLKDW